MEKWAPSVSFFDLSDTTGGRGQHGGGLEENLGRRQNNKVQSVATETLFRADMRLSMIAAQTADIFKSYYPKEAKSCSKSAWKG
jgi:hypothetical protein